MALMLFLIEACERRDGRLGPTRNPYVYLCTFIIVWKPSQLCILIEPADMVSTRGAAAAWFGLLVLAHAYDITDPRADHTSYAIEMDEAGDIAAAIASFAAAATFGA